MTRKIEIVEALPKLEKLPNFSRVGTYSVSLPNNTMLVPFHYYREFEGQTGTEISITRSFLYTLKKRIAKQKEYFGYLQSRPSLYVEPAIIENAAYVDVKSAYASIYYMTGWNVDYCRGKYFSPSSSPLVYPYPENWKAGRSFVVTGARHEAFSRIAYNGQIITRKYGSPFYNPSLVASVYDILATIGLFCVYSLGGKYWATDGGILPEKNAKILVDFIASMGLQAKIKYTGKAEIFSNSFWRIGKHETKNMNSSLAFSVSGGNWIPIEKNNAEWVYKQMEKISKFRTVQNGN